ncbi:serine/threonine-protein kinase [Nakamurella sp.]|uniref:serine/threonine-protein kinase n=1 Tax=Nakamurella sp. TaxID=1869182 RepID=UPI003784B66E
MSDVVAGRYALIDPIGSGGSGTVWRAYDRRRGAYCAAKLLRQRDAGELLRFVREQSVRLDHPHIVSPYNWAAEDGTVLIASELVAGGSLHTLIGDYGPLAEGTVVALLYQVLAGLAAVHDAELIHRDVKPANVLLRVTGTGPLHAVLTDFGLTISRRDARLTQVGTVIGTPGYLPPEVLVGGVPPDPRHDLYAVGRLAVTLLGGAEPVGPAVDVVDTVRDPVLRRAVDALLRRDPAERPPNVPAAVALLAGAGADAAPRTRDGDPVEVLDQLPALAAGAGMTVPPAPAGGPVTVIDVAPTAPRTGRPDPRPAAVTPAPPGNAPPGSASAGPTSAPAPGPATAPAPGPATASAPATAPASGPAAPPARPRRRSGRVLAALAGGLVLVVAVVLGVRLIGGTGGGDPSSPPPTGTSTSQSTGSASPPGSVDARVGDECTWQQEGDRRTGADGVLVCTLADGAYRWRAA